MNQRHDNLSDDDIALFRESVGNVRPLTDDSADTGRPTPPAKARFRRQDDQAVLRDAMQYDPEEILETGEELRFERPGLRPDVLRRLRRGRIPVRDHLDLHGLNWRDARETVSIFLAECHEQRIDCVRIVHGKGLRSGNTGPVLKAKLNSWLRKRADVLAFCSARPTDGGTGAIYVLISGET